MGTQPNARLQPVEGKERARPGTGPGRVAAPPRRGRKEGPRATPRPPAPWSPRGGTVSARNGGTHSHDFFPVTIVGLAYFLGAALAGADDPLPAFVVNVEPSYPWCLITGLIAIFISGCVMGGWAVVRFLTGGGKET